MEFEGSGVASFESFCEGSAGLVWEQLLGCPESYRRGSGTRTLEGDFSEVEIFGREVGVRGVVFVEATNCGVTEENTAAAIGLKAVFVGIDDDGVGVGNSVKGGAGFGG